ncbi:MAG: FAD-dependent oxidoreductase [Thermodesulfobacteriota bacterium]
MESGKQKLNIAIVGSGPAGFYTADRLIKKSGAEIQIDMFDTLPTPHGLVRHGVAPDHQKIKTVARMYDKIAAHPSFRFFGFVEFGKDITLADLKKRYHQIVFATGAQTDKRMEIPGEDLPGSHTATEFVAWYNGHPHSSELDFEMSGSRAIIIGVGNVAIDVARILCLSGGELGKTDIADYAMKKLEASGISEIYIIGRRGPAQAAFTNPELRELGALEDALAVTREEDLNLDPVSKRFLEENPNAATAKKLEILESFSRREQSGEKKTLHLRFLLSPVAMESGKDGRVASATFVKNRLERREDGTVRAVPTGETETIRADIVFRSIGYRGIALKDVPFDDSAGVIPNGLGRVLDAPGGGALTGLYTAGWIKRGATGVIGTNKTDSAETVDLMIEDAEKGVLFAPDEKAVSIEALLDERKPDYISYQKWSVVDEKEKKRGEVEGRPRVKYTTIEEIMKALKS